MLIDKKIYKKSLAELWNSVFGDSYDFIELIFKPEYDSSILCFGEIIDYRVVSAFYLIENTLKFKGKYYNGYYLYAAATLPEYRKGGMMSRHINEAIAYCKKENIDFISLVPSEESLYSYYSRFGFSKAMYRFINSKTSSCAAVAANLEAIIDKSRIFEIRNKYEGNIISFAPRSFGYALDCLSFSGFSFSEVSDDACLLSSADDEFAELVSTKKSLEHNLSEISGRVSALTSPFELRGFDENKCVPFGMLYPINSSLKRNWEFTDIYMNIALD